MNVTQSSSQYKCVMGNIDSVPILSQVKSLIQVIAGDESGALATQLQFARTGIIASQVSKVITAQPHNNNPFIQYLVCR